MPAVLQGVGWGHFSKISKAVFASSSEHSSAGKLSGRAGWSDLHAGSQVPALCLLVLASVSSHTELFSLCAAVSENGPHRLTCLNACLVPIGGTVLEGLAGVVVLEELCHWGWALRFQK